MQPTQEPRDALLQANRIVDESRSYREEGESALVERAWEYSNAANARLNAEQNRAVSQMAGLGDQQSIVESLERAVAKEVATRDAFVKEFKGYLARRTAKSNARRDLTSGVAS
jgi:hypothetical protein